MTMHIHHLTGCAPAPLAHYLKALGILRLVAEQADPHARGWWQDEHFCLTTKLDYKELQRFFLEKYKPTPVFNPWGGRSGYYGGSPEATVRAALTVIEASPLDRLTMFRVAIALIRNAIEEIGGSKPDTDESKLQLVRSIQQHVRGSGSDWLGAVLADLGESFQGPAIMGTGGNEGSGSYTAAYLAAVSECIVNRHWDNSLASTLFSKRTEAEAWDGSFADSNGKKKTVNGPFRQFLPEGDASPWDLILMFEGSLLFRSGLTRRSVSDRNRFMSSPFYFAARGAGASSSAVSDEYVMNKGRQNLGRGEQWFPVWHQPASFTELLSLISEGKCSIRGKHADRSVDAARAISQLGVSRGINGFIRYGYLQRDNLATHFAVPLGRIEVRHRPHARLIDDIAPWLDRLHRLARGKHAPACLIHAERRLADALFGVLTHDETSERWQ
ncbi:MAG: type I-U CRISPR-associated protein Csx17, partial [bacterium]